MLSVTKDVRLSGAADVSAAAAIAKYTLPFIARVGFNGFHLFSRLY